METDNKQEIIDAIKTINGHLVGIRKAMEVLTVALMKAELRERAIKKLGDAAL